MKPRRNSFQPVKASIGLVLISSVLGGCVSNPERYQKPSISLPETFQKTPAGDTPPAESPALRISRTLQSWPVGPLERPPLGMPGAGQPVSSSPVLADVPLTLDKQPPELIALGEALPEWWKLLGNTELNGLIDRALAGNPDIRIANLRIAQAKARADQADADRYPVITAPLEVSMEAPRNGIGTVSAGQRVTSRKIYKASLRGDWRPDLWGEKEAQLQAADLQIWRSNFQRDDIQRNVISSIVIQYIEYLSLNERLRVARETETVLSGMLASVDERMHKGDATVIDMQQQRSAVYAVKATIPALEQQREEALTALALLVGTIPGQLQLDENSGLDRLSYPSVMPGAPSTLLFRRPDIRAAEARMLAAGADIGTARARVLPPLDLSAQIGYGSLRLARLLQPQSLMWNFVASLAATIFDKGKRNKEIEYAKAVHEEMVETYISTIRKSVKEAEDALNATQKTGKRAIMQMEATDAARLAYSHSNEAYRAGAIDYLTLLDTERTYHKRLDELHQIRMDHYKALAELLTALGGGVATGEAPTDTGDGGSVTAIRPAPSNATEGIEPASSDISTKSDVWLAELSGMHDRNHIAPIWRDLRERYPQWMKERFLLPRLVSGAPMSEPSQGKASLYRLFVARFTSEQDASEFCTALETGQQMHCQARQGVPRTGPPFTAADAQSQD